MVDNPSDEKIQYLLKLKSLEQRKGIIVTQNYTAKTDIEDIKAEYYHQLEEIAQGPDVLELKRLEHELELKKLDHELEMKKIENEHELELKKLEYVHEMRLKKFENDDEY